MKLYDLSQPLNQEVPFWPYYPPFEVKYIKRKAEHGVNAQYIMTSNHMGTHLDAPRHFVTAGMTIDEIPLEWLYGPPASIVTRSSAPSPTRRSTSIVTPARTPIWCPGCSRSRSTSGVSTASRPTTR
jgi:kynurenine formamidase